MGYIGKITDTAGSTHLVGSTLYGTCSTAAGTAAKVVTCPEFGELVTGVTIHVKFDNANLNTEMGATLNVNNTGAKTIVGGIGGDLLPGQGFRWAAGCVVSFTYDGTYWVMNDSYLNTSTDTKVTQTATTTNSNYPILFKNSADQTDETNQVRYGNTSSAIPTINPAYGWISAHSVRADNFNNVTIDPAAQGNAYRIVISVSDELGGGLPRLVIPSNADYALGAACEMGVDSSIPSSGWSATSVPTTAAVANYVASAISGGNAFMGSLVVVGGNASTTWTDAQVQAASYTKGQYWVCSMAGTYCGKVLEAGDMLFCVSDKSSAYSANDFSAVQNNIETLTTAEIDNDWTAAVAVS